MVYGTPCLNTWQHCFRSTPENCW
ncbi:BnaC02g09060D [Brassica napus]|uniref:BnaC02g09060D protein n=1 Tax=Brassica napus TaxID=3708 RepID=A0A078HUW2_BRANA|nr:BnaC02g09060D [Brassica napus]